MEEEIMDFVPEKEFYQPSNDETWESYQALICIVEQQLGGYPRTVVCGVADEILGIFRNRCLNQVRKRFEIEKLIGIVSIDVFNQLVLSTNEINDYNRAKQKEETWSNNRQQEVVEEEEEEEEEGYFYQPRSSETWRAYNTLLNVVVHHCGVQPQLVLCCAANELIQVLKNEDIEEADLKKRLIGGMLNLGFVSDQLFLELVAIVGLITDYKPGEFVGPTDVIREDSLLMMMGMETTQLAAVKKEEDRMVIWQSTPLQWSSDEEEEEEQQQLEDPMVEDENVGPIVNDLMVKNENVSLVNYDYDYDDDDDDDDDDLVLVVNDNVRREFMEKLVLHEKDESTNEIKKEDDDEDEWVVV